MPALTMRGRYLMREYWSDSDLFLRLTAEQRELYVGLWMLADDDGWLPRDIPGVAAGLFRYDEPEVRVSRVRTGLERLAKLGKVSSFRCCLYLPAVSRYPRAGKKSTEHHDEHRRHAQRVQIGSKQSNDIQTDLNPSPDPTLRNPSLPDVASARTPERRAARGGPMTDAAQVAGGFVADLAKRKLA